MKEWSHDCAYGEYTRHFGAAQGSLRSKASCPELRTLRCYLQIGLLSDTHGFLDPALFSYFDKCDEVWHAGDFGPVEVLDELKSFKPLRGVWGNIDGAEVRASVPRHLEWECEGMKIYMTHIAGYPGAWDKQAKTALDKIHPDLAICGHSHILKVMRDQARELIHLNPGAAGTSGMHTMRTALRFEIDDGKLHELVAIELGPRGNQKPK